jgi:glycosyltransferase involved in cell wall biosynthesis
VKILFVSHAFSPSVGGIESMSRLLAAGFVRAGHSVKVVTHTPGERDGGEAYPVIRRPGPREMWGLFSWCDLVVHSNITLRGLWPLVLIRRRWIVIHHTWIRQPMGGLSLSSMLKLAVLPAAESICVSSALADALPVGARVIPNCYDDEVFRGGKANKPSRDVIFVGRLVPDKGVDLLLEAIRALARDGLRPGVTVVGTGPEEASLRALSSRLGLESQVVFAGQKKSEEVAALMRDHRVLAVPSRWREPFGMVALEGIASGCIVVGSCEGGLADAIGPGGLTFPNGDVSALATALACALRAPAPPNPEAVARHLKRHRADQIVRRYLEIIEAAPERVPDALQKRLSVPPHP